MSSVKTSGRVGSMLFLKATDYDTGSGMLRLQFVNASGKGRTTYEFRDVSVKVVDNLADANPHPVQFIKSQIVPFHANRRAGTTEWHAPNGQRPRTFFQP